jgi:hypothetical protein
VQQARSAYLVRRRAATVALATHALLDQIHRLQLWQRAQLGPLASPERRRAATAAPGATAPSQRAHPRAI